MVDALSSVIKREFVKAFRNKLVHFVDDPIMFMEWGIAAYLDPR